MDASIMSAAGLLQEARARARYHDDWDRNYVSLREESDRNERMLAIWTVIEKVALLFRRRAPAPRAAHA